MLDLRNSETGKQLIGTFFDVDSPLVMECVALSGMDFAIVDLEHSPLDTNAAVELICRGHLHGMSVLIRPSDFSRASLLKALDAGADGLIVPGIASVADAEKAVEYAKYCPVGNRGVALARAAKYGKDPQIPDLPHLFSVKNRETKLILQCETVGCLEAVETIAAMDGVDGLFIGPYDLTTDLGKAGQFSDPEVKKAFERVFQACRKAGKPVLIFSPTVQDKELRLREGYDAVAVSTVATAVIESCGRLADR